MLHSLDTCHLSASTWISLPQFQMLHMWLNVHLHNQAWMLTWILDKYVCSDDFENYHVLFKIEVWVSAIYIINHTIFSVVWFTWFSSIYFDISYIFTCSRWVSLQWRRNEHNDVSNHQPHDCLLNRLFRRKSKKTSKLRVAGLMRGIHRWPVNSPNKWPVTRKMFPFDDVTMFGDLFITKIRCLFSKFPGCTRAPEVTVEDGV